MNENIVKAMKELANAFSGKNVLWCVCAGAASSFYGVKRNITDLDVLVHPTSLPQITEALKQKGINFQIEEKDHEVTNGNSGLTSLKVKRAKISVGGAEVELIFDVNINNKWNFTADREMYNRIKFFGVTGTRIPVSSPEDVIVLKAILQRNRSFGKHDIEDAVQIMKTIRLDIDYLRRRASKGHAGARVMPLITKLAMVKKIRRTQKPNRESLPRRRRLRRR